MALIYLPTRSTFGPKRLEAPEEPQVCVAIIKAIEPSPPSMQAPPERPASGRQASPARAHLLTSVWLLPAPVVVQLLHHRRAPGGDGGGGDGGGGRQEMQLLKIFARLRRADGCARLRRAWAVVP